MSDYNFELKPAVKEAIPALIGLWGKSGSGKTYSALLLARGMVGPKGKIAFIDTENGRAKFYAGVAGGWQHLDLQPPFTPEKYSAAFKFCEDQGAKVIVVDSMSHVWEGEGGVLDQADANTNKGLAKYKPGKTAHKRMTNKLTRSAIPVIFCIRAKDAVKQIGSGNDMKIVSLGWQPIAEKNFVFEMTVDLHMVGDGHYDLETSKNVPEDLRSVIKPGGTVNEEMGRGIAAWAGSGQPVDEKVITLKRDALDAAMQGVKVYTEFLATLNDDQKSPIKSFHKEWSAIAKAADERNVEQPDGMEDI